MSEGIRIKKGLSINIKGVAEKELKKVPLSNQLALILDDFHLVVPTIDMIINGTSLSDTNLIPINITF